MELVIWQGFDHYWQREPHRLRRIGSWIEMGGEDHRLDYTYCSAMQIGRFPPDICHTHSMMHRTGTATSRQIDGQATGLLAGRLGQRVEISGEAITHRLPSGDLTATVVMRGFELRSQFSHGFQTRGFGLGLTDIQHGVEDGAAVIRFTPRYFIFPDRSPDPATDPDHLLWRVLPFPAWLEPGTPPEFSYTMTLYYSVIYDRADAARFTPHDIHYAPMPSRYVGPSAGRRSVPHTLDGVGEGAYGSASVGIRGFQWELLSWPHTRRDGRYLRKIQCMLDGLDYDPQRGSLSISTKMEFNNFGGRQGREQVRSWIAFLRAHRKKDRNRLRTLARALRMAYGFTAQYDLYATLLQFKDGGTHPASHLYNVIRRRSDAKQRVRF